MNCWRLLELTADNISFYDVTTYHDHKARLLITVRYKRERQHSALVQWDGKYCNQKGMGKNLFRTVRTSRLASGPEYPFQALFETKLYVQDAILNYRVHPLREHDTIPNPIGWNIYVRVCVHKCRAKGQSRRIKRKAKLESKTGKTIESSHLLSQKSQRTCRCWLK